MEGRGGSQKSGVEEFKKGKGDGSEEKRVWKRMSECVRHGR